MNQTLIIGCGELGTPLGQKLIESGHVVTGIRRNIHKLPECIKGVSMDLAKKLPEPEWLATFHLVYVILTPAERSEAAYRKMYGDTIPQLMERLSHDESPQRIILTSSTHVYAESQGGKVDEETPTEGYDYRSESLVAAEESLKQLQQRTKKKEGICVRFSGLYTQNSTYIFNQIESGKPISNPEHYTNRIHREDAVGFLHHLAKLPRAQSVYLASDSHPVQRKVFFTAIAKSQQQHIQFDDNLQVGGKQCLNQRLKNSGYSLTYPSYIEGYQLKT
jgi:nucleoside-diphosphate-sugar epimerase